MFQAYSDDIGWLAGRMVYIIIITSTAAGTKGINAMASRNHFGEKAEALRRRGALNPNPQRVTDERFAASDFFDPRDLVQVKYEMLRRVQQEGWSVTRAARTFGSSRVAFYRALATFKQAGILGLLPRPRGPRDAHKLSIRVMGFVHQELEQDPSLSTADVARMIERRFGISIHRRSIERALKRPRKRLRKGEEKKG